MGGVASDSASWNSDLESERYVCHLPDRVWLVLGQLDRDGR